MTDLGLGDKVRDKLRRGLLPLDEPAKTWVGHGSGRPCSACGDPVLGAQIEYELEMADKTAYPLHLGCHGLWFAERLRGCWHTNPPRTDPS